ncbi:hypothetical protein GO986_12875 [Deinococcus sp. HMF7620]|uniref:DUF3352 domain-containing protein n=1 Tax=Deinococcus arboris TaxID=2682977 RepID=A0A7C9LP40_9DEIO|nr:hypothetical protein [Deinococcus arboris]MVN87656.1 hypothetical protein [Deinococcus arboris]
MTRFLTAASLLTLSLAGAASAQSAQKPLATSLPAGALLTLETKNAAPALKRFGGVLTRVLDAVQLDEEDSPAAMLDGVQALLTDFLGREGVAGVFAVQEQRNTFTPELLAVARAGELSREMLGSKKPGARVGNYTFSRQGDLFAGQSGGLVYVSTNKALLMSYLGRLSGKAAPTLATSAAYAAVSRAAGTNEFGLYANFSATAKVIRSSLTQVFLPRLLSPVVDAIDTLGQVAGGLTTTASGLTTTSAQAVNTAGKDAPLRRILTATTDFGVQDIIPANVEAVQASACAPESGAYLGRWLTRIDLLEPFGFLTDSQLASHLERSGAYLGGECAQVTLAGGTKASLNQEDPLASLAASVSYQRVTDQAAAEAHLPEYAASVNSAIQGVRATLKETLGGAMKGVMDGEDMDALGGMGMVGLGAAMQSMEQVDTLLAGLKMVYGFRDGYLITAFSDEALQAALDETPATLGQSAAFRAAGLDTTASAAFGYTPDLPALTGQDLLGSLPEDLQDEDLNEFLAPVMNAAADVINRFDGMTSQRGVSGNVIIGKANVRYRW